MGAADDSVSGDAALISASLQLPERFGTIFERHAEVIYKFLARQVGGDHADDLLSETFTTAFQVRSHFDSRRSSALPWLLGIAVNVTHHHQRSSWTRSRLAHRFGLSRVEDAEVLVDVERRLDAAALRAPIDRALEALSAAQREVLVLAASADLSYEEMAEILVLPVGTVRSRLSRARRCLRLELARFDEMGALAELQEEWR